MCSVAMPFHFTTHYVKLLRAQFSNWIISKKKKKTYRFWFSLLAYCDRFIFHVISLLLKPVLVSLLSRMKTKSKMYVLNSLSVVCPMSSKPIFFFSLAVVKWVRKYLFNVWNFLSDFRISFAPILRFFFLLYAVASPQCIREWVKIKANKNVNSFCGWIHFERFFSLFVCWLNKFAFKFERNQTRRMLAEPFKMRCKITRHKYKH